MEFKGQMEMTDVYKETQVRHAAEGKVKTECFRSLLKGASCLASVTTVLRGSFRRP